ncbi:mechanosensitive ion channel domain-containing protein [Paracraurococcus lichenis]|uniref:Mechanosensitive ion channel n=1 Tax=Paracraurococcus lichenis TaxID=3064888 RepID=A0ABT9DW88_9PROT|nr:mechanosensitive ion channel domain-containing protein [Paracraurococcus sp. LOR1-02]MDO9708170.1 mechanosensitive ion channel [Paracraurococcus sp. LOR1-02]
MRLLRILLLGLLLLPGPGGRPAIAQPAGLTSADLERAAALLRDDARRAEFLRTLEALAAASRSAPPHAAPQPAAGRAAPAPAAVQPAGPPPAPAAASPAPTNAPAAEGSEAEATPPPAAAPAPAPAAQGGAQGAAPGAAPATPPAAPDPLIAPNTVGAQILAGLSGRVRAVAEEALDGIRSMADLPALWDAAEDLVRDPVSRTRLLDAAWKLLVLTALGLCAEWLMVRVVTRPRRWLDTMALEADDTPWAWLKRAPLVLGRLLVDLLPIAAFGLAVYGLFGLMQPLPTTRLVGLMMAHTYMGARIAFAVARMLLSPASDHLRLIPCGNAAAVWGIRWLRRLMLVGLGGYTLAEAGLLLGLPWSAYDAIINLTLLVISLLLARIVLQQREAVAALLRADPLPAGEEATGTRHLLRSARDQLADIWHVLVILWLIVAWAVWALALENGLHRLAVGTVLTVLIVGLAKALDEGIAWSMDRVLHPGPEMAKRFPGLAVRAAQYVPLLKTLVSALLGGASVVLLLEVWGFNSLAWFEPGTLGRRLLDTFASIGVTLVMALVVWEAANSAIQRRLHRLSRDSQAARSARVRTLLPMLRTVLGVVILVFVVLNALAQLGINVAPLLAGAGVVGLAIGFGSQTLVRDVITGVFLLLEDAVAVGDVVQLGGLSGVVEHLSIRSIKLRATDGSVHIVPFSAVTTVTNMTRDFSFAVLDVTVAYSEDTDRVVAALKEIGAEIRGEAKWKPLIRDDIDVWGVEKLADNGVAIRARVKTEPAARWPVAREFNRRIKQRFDELGIMIPRPQPMVLVERPAEPRAPDPDLAQAAQ